MSAVPIMPTTCLPVRLRPRFFVPWLQQARHTNRDCMARGGSLSRDGCKIFTPWQEHSCHAAPCRSPPQLWSSRVSAGSLLRSCLCAEIEQKVVEEAVGDAFGTLVVLFSAEDCPSVHAPYRQEPCRACPPRAPASVLSIRMIGGHPAKEKILSAAALEDQRCDWTAPPSGAQPVVLDCTIA